MFTPFSEKRYLHHHIHQSYQNSHQFEYIGFVIACLFFCFVLFFAVIASVLTSFTYVLTSCQKSFFGHTLMSPEGGAKSGGTLKI